MTTIAVVAQAPAPPTPIMTERSTGTGPLDRLWFRSIGPATPSGRVDDLAVLESDPTTFYVGMATAGVYKTTNAGTTFTSVFDNESSSSVGAIAIAPTDANLVWVGTGEANNRQSSSWGDGVYKSTDGGRSWRNMGLRDSQAGGAHHRRSRRLQRRLRRVAGQSVGAGRRARRLQDHRRRR